MATWSKLTVHGWIYGVEDGLLRDLALSLSSTAEMKAAVHRLSIKTRANLMARH
jgi:carbonic anhydrase